MQLRGNCLGWSLLPGDLCGEELGEEVIVGRLELFSPLSSVSPNYYVTGNYRRITTPKTSKLSPVQTKMLKGLISVRS
jgi:hypothetical protein